MSLRGRYIIDRLKKFIGQTFQLPVPPYGEPSYWDASYRSFGPYDRPIEWGEITLSDLNKYQFRTLEHWENDNAAPRNSAKPSSTDPNIDNRPSSLTPSSSSSSSSSPSSSSSSSLGDVLGVQPNSEKQEPILMLGCGNSRLGEEMIEIGGWTGPIIQVDVSSRVIETMSERCQTHVDDGTMNFVHDDAVELSAFQNNTISGCIDKGLIDALYCANEHEQCASVLQSVYRTLQPGCIFMFLSFSRPEFLLPDIVNTNNYRTKRRSIDWYSIEVHELSSIILYRFQKNAPSTIANKKNKKKKKNQ